MPMNLIRRNRVHIRRNLDAITDHDPSVEVAPASVGLAPDAAERMWKSVVSLYRSGLHPGITLAVRYRGQLVLKRAIGRSPDGEVLEPDAPLCLFSASKAISALLVHRLVADGAISLDDRVADYIPEFSPHGKHRVTIRQLLAHRAGVPTIAVEHRGPELLRDWDRLLDLLCAAKPSDLRFETRAYPGDTLSTLSEITGLRPTSDGKAGIVYVRSLTRNQYDETVVSWNRWVMVRKRNESAAPPETHVPDLPDLVPAEALTVPAGADFSGYDAEAAGSPHLWEDYSVGERIDHIDGMSIEEAEHMMATRLYQNTARVHLDRHLAQGSRFGRPLVYGGHVMSLARALSFNGLANAAFIAAINGGRHAAPSFAGDTIYAWSAVLDRQPLPARADVGALRLRTVAVKDRPCVDFPGAEGDDPSIVLDLDYWVLMPRRG